MEGFVNMIKKVLTIILIITPYTSLRAYVIERAQGSFRRLFTPSTVVLDDEGQKAYELLGKEIDNNSEFDSTLHSGMWLESLCKRICFTKIDGAEESDVRTALLGVLAIAQKVLIECVNEKKVSLNNFGVRNFFDALHGEIASFYSTYVTKIGVSPLTLEEQRDDILSQKSKDGSIISIKEQIDNFVKTDEKLLNEGLY